jgi:hypothetical protein
MSWLLRSVLPALLCGVSVSLVAAPRETLSALSIRLHDYAQIDSRTLGDAEQRVSATYERAGVQITWRMIVRPIAVTAGRAAWPTDPQAVLTVVLLAPSMDRQHELSGDVAGYAPISREHGGRIAYVSAERAAAMADETGVSYADVLAGVITHEVAHLLMPSRSHSPDGIMRAHWGPTDFRDFWRQRFSPAETLSIRDTVAAIGGAPQRRAD